ASTNPSTRPTARATTPACAGWSVTWSRSMGATPVMRTCSARRWTGWSARTHRPAGGPAPDDHPTAGRGRRSRDPTGQRGHVARPDDGLRHAWAFFALLVPALQAEAARELRRPTGRGAAGPAARPDRMW